MLGNTTSSNSYQSWNNNLKLQTKINFFLVMSGQIGLQMKKTLQALQVPMSAYHVDDL
jgi:hypothetical protein